MEADKRRNKQQQKEKEQNHVARSPIASHSGRVIAMAMHKHLLLLHLWMQIQQSWFSTLMWRWGL
jgi:hypothetical protein